MMMVSLRYNEDYALFLSTEAVLRIIDANKTVFESEGSSVITVVLTGANSDTVFVDVLNSTGKIY